MNTRLLGLTVLAALASLPARAQTAQELVNGANDTGNVVNYGMGYGEQRYSTLQQINKSTVKMLVPAWNYSLDDNRGQESQALVYKGVLFITTHNATMAVDAKTGKQIWKTKIEYPPETPRVACCGIVNRGAAIFDGKVYRTTLDANVVAYDMKTGAEVWKQNAIDFKAGYSMTVAPLVAEGVVITGISGAEFGTRGFLDGWDAATGKHLWRTYTIPGPGERGHDTWTGDSWQRGGGSTWLTGSYDPELHTVYWGVGNPGPWNPMVRKGDNLYTSSVLALEPKTGRIKWHYQFSPNDAFDYDGTNELVQATLTIDGKPAKVIMQANRNGFFYVIDRASGKLLAANPFVNQNWAKGIDLKTGRPVLSEVAERAHAGGAVKVSPSVFGGKNWMPMSFNPNTGIVYANTVDSEMDYEAVAAEYRPGTFYFGAKFVPGFPRPTRGALKAIDPRTGKAKWEAGSDIPRFAGTLVTAGGLVFTGKLTGEFEAFDADTGAKLWQFQTGSGIEGQPVTWEQDGVQYIAITSGNGGVYTLFSGDERLKAVPAGGSLWVFALAGKQ